jgi:hypothetical protein
MTAALSALIATCVFAALAVLNSFIDGPGSLTLLLSVLSTLAFLIILAMLAADYRADNPNPRDPPTPL